MVRLPQQLSLQKAFTRLLDNRMKRQRIRAAIFAPKYVDYDYTVKTGDIDINEREDESTTD